MKNRSRMVVRALGTMFLAGGMFLSPQPSLADEVDANQVLMTVDADATSLTSEDVICSLEESILTQSEASNIASLVHVVSYSPTASGMPSVKSLTRGVDYEIAAISTDAKSETGTVALRGIGSYSGDVVLDFCVVDAIDLADANIFFDGTYGIPSQFATGEKIEPTVLAVSVSKDDYRYHRTLSKSDYVVSYRNNINPGTGSVVLKPSSNGVCKGELISEFEIADRNGFVIDGSRNGAHQCQMEIDLEQTPQSRATILPQPIFPLRGSSVEPTVTIEVLGRDGNGWLQTTNIELVEGRDYVLEYENNDRPGTAKVTAKGINGISGSVSCDFQIANGKIDVNTLDLDNWCFEQGKYEYHGTPVTPKLREHGFREDRMKQPVLLQSGDYELSYANNNAVGICTVTVTGKGPYYTGSTAVEVPIVAAGVLPTRPDMSEYTVDTISPIEYTGQRQRPHVVLRDSKGNVVDEHQYYVIYENNLKVGTAHAYVSGQWVKDGTGVPAITGPTLDVPFQIVAAGSESGYDKDGWVDLAGGGKGYAKGGKLVTGWFDLGSAKYYFQPDGSMSVGWTDVEVDGKEMHYYFNPASGNLVRDTWFTIGEATYYFRPSGNLATGWATIKDAGVDKKYYFEPDGTLVRDTWYDVVNDEGVTNHYYFRPSGAMATGWATIDGRQYFFRPSGNMATGWADVTNDNGVTAKHYFDEGGAMLTGWQQIGPNTYYFRPSGAMQTGEATIDGVAHTFTDKGVLVG